MVNSLSAFLLLIAVAVPTMADIFYLNEEASAFYSINYFFSDGFKILSQTSSNRLSWPFTTEDAYKQNK